MKYINGKSILPQKLLDEVQTYIEGEIIYIPRKDDKKKRWGEKSGAREYLKKRNIAIIKLHENGTGTKEISEKFHLSCESIKKIIYNFNIDK